MIRTAILTMALGAAMLVSGCNGAGGNAEGQGTVPGKKESRMALSAAEREAATSAATRFVETADRALYEQLWSEMPKTYRDSHEYRDFETRLAARAKAIGTVDEREAASAEVVDADGLGVGRGRFALVIFCTRSQGGLFVDGVVVKRNGEGDWVPARHQWGTAASMQIDENRGKEPVFGPCRDMTTGDTGA